MIMYIVCVSECVCARAHVCIVLYIYIYIYIYKIFKKIIYVQIILIYIYNNFMKKKREENLL